MPANFTEGGSNVTVKKISYTGNALSSFKTPGILSKHVQELCAPHAIDEHHPNLVRPHPNGRVFYRRPTVSVDCRMERVVIRLFVPLARDYEVKYMSTQRFWSLLTYCDSAGFVFMGEINRVCREPLRY